MDEERVKSVKLVNDSGFPLQLRVEHEIRSTFSTHGWEVLSKEHAWADEESKEEGFIDLVLGHCNLIVRLVIECKRRRGDAARWVFLVADQKKIKEDRIRCLWADSQPKLTDLHGWEDFRLSPESPESEFCIVAGQSDRDKPMLEGTSEILLKSMERLAFEEMQLARIQNPPERHLCIYLPVIVTTARLEVCRLNPDDISLEDGTLLPGKGEIEAVDFIRFRKSLSTQLSSNFTPKDLATANRDKERTILVVRAAAISKALQGWKLAKSDIAAMHPWNKARVIENADKVLDSDS